MSNLLRANNTLHLLGFVIAISLTAFYGSYLRGIADNADLELKRNMLYYEKVQLEFDKVDLLCLLPLYLIRQVNRLRQRRAHLANNSPNALG